MSLVEMVMPKMGESVMEGTILKWLKQPGDAIEQDESVLEVATDKVDTDVPAPYAGVLKEILAKEGEIIAVDKPIAIIDTSNENTATSTSLEPINAQEPATGTMVHAEVAEAPATVASKQDVAQTSPQQSGRFYSPLVMNIARQENIPLAELDTMEGTGKDGRVTKKDIFRYLENRTKPAQETQEQIPVHQTPTSEKAKQNGSTHKSVSSQSGISKVDVVSTNGQEEIIEMDRMRQMIAERMVASKQTSPHVTSFVEADVTDIVAWRNREKARFLKEHQCKLTFTPIFIQAIAKAIRDFPMVNISVDGNNIIRKKEVNIGMAVALPSGNLIVPVIKNADHLTLTGLALRVNDLADRARENRLQPDELSGGTYTMSNVGTFGNVMGTPIIVQPQVAIMAFGAIQKKPAVIETPQGDFIGIRQLMFLSHSYDHRVVDGSLGGMFVKKVADYLTNFDTTQKI